MRRTVTVLTRAFLLLLICLPMSFASAAESEARVVVLPIRHHATSAFDESVTRLIERPLHRYAKTIPASSFNAALKRARIRGLAMFSGKNVRKVGKAVNATHVLIVEAGPKVRFRTVVDVTLFEVHTGETLLVEQYFVAGGKLTPELAAKILAPVLEKLLVDKSGDEEEASPEETPANKRERDAMPAPTHNTPPAPARGRDHPKGFSWPDSNEPTDRTGPPVPKAKPIDRPVALPTTDIADPANADHANARFGVGLILLQRDAHMTTASSVVTPPCYCGSSGNANPFFPGLSVSGEIFPLAWVGSNDWYRQFGLQAEMFYARVKSYVDFSPNHVVSSNLINLRLGPTYRLPFGSGDFVPDLQTSIGFSHFAFPLNSGGFPGVSYTAPYLSTTFHAPIVPQRVTLFVGGGFLPWLKGGSEMKVLGTQTGGYGLSFDGGVRVNIYRGIEITALARYDVSVLHYTGQTSLTGLPVQLQNAGLRDRLIEGVVTAGLHF